MSFFKRIFLFVLVNLAIIAVLMTVTSIFGIEPYLQKSGLNLQSLAIYSAVIGFSGSLISLFLSKTIAKWTLGVQIIDSPKSSDEAKIVEIVGRVANQIGISTPEVGIYNSPEVNAFATGWSRNHSLVAVSSGLLDEMSDEEIEGVLAHEMAHVANGDMVTMTLIQGVVNTFVVFASRVAAFAIQKFFSKNDDDAVGGISYWLISILFEILFGILASLLVFWFSRHREFRADAGGAKFVGKAKMIAALQRLQRTADAIDPRGKSLATMKISDRSSIAKLFSTHPPLELRIQKLREAMIS